MSDMGNVVAANAEGDSWVSELDVNDEAMSRIAFGLARECHDFAAKSGIPDRAVKGYLGVCFNELSRNLHDFVLISPVITDGASKLSLSISFSPAVDRRTAEAAKNSIVVRHREISQGSSPVDQAAESIRESTSASCMALREGVIWGVNAGAWERRCPWNPCEDVDREAMLILLMASGAGFQRDDDYMRDLLRGMKNSAACCMTVILTTALPIRIC